LAACRQRRLSTLVVAGGVGANRRLRQRLDVATLKQGVRVCYPETELCTDNGAMIAFAGAQHLLAGGYDVKQERSRNGGFAVRPRWPLQEL